MKSYHRTEVMREGQFFRCYNCNKVLVSHYSGTRFKLVLTCPRCKTVTTVKVGEVAPHALEDENLVETCLVSLLEVLGSKSRMCGLLKKAVMEIRKSKEGKT